MYVAGKYLKNPLIKRNDITVKCNIAQRNIRLRRMRRGRGRGTPLETEGRRKVRDPRGDGQDDLI